MSAMLALVVRLAVTVLLPCVAAAGVMPSLSAGLPVHPSVVDIGFRDCHLPCWADIQPGQTSFADAGERLRKALPRVGTRIDRSMSEVMFWTRDVALPGGFYTEAAGQVGYLRLYVTLPIGELIRRLGTPDCIWLAESYTNQTVHVVYWEDEGTLTGAMLLPQAGGWGPMTLTTNLWMDTTSTACNQPEAVAWAGFVPLWRRDIQPST